MITNLAFSQRIYYARLTVIQKVLKIFKLQMSASTNEQIISVEAGRQQCKRRLECCKWKINLKQQLLFIIIIINYPMNRKQSNYSPEAQDQGRNQSRVHHIDAHKQRVAQTNMVYLIGLPESIAEQQTLREPAYCGQYGKIIKVLVKQNFINNYASHSAYVTYEDEVSAAMAILGLNNFMIQKNRIYASYGTNKYCSTFVRYGKCRKVECPFLHKIQKQKEIREEDNKRLFQQQQQSARKFFIQNYQRVTFDKFQEAVFTSKQQILQWFIEDGSIKIKKDEKKSKEETTPRVNAMKQNFEKCSEGGSTECSPAREHNEEISEESKIQQWIASKVRSSKCSLFSFANCHPASESEEVGKKLKKYLLESTI